MFNWFKREVETHPQVEVEQPIVTVEGANKQFIYLFNNRLVIANKSWLMEAARGIQPQREIYLSSLAGLQVKEPGFWNGYITLLFHGDQDVDNKGIMAKAFSNDPHTIFFEKKEWPNVVRLKAEIDKRK